MTPDFSCFRRTRFARRTLPGNATRSTNAEKRCLKSDDKIKRLPKTRTTIDFTACREFHLIQSREFHLIQNAYRRTQPKAFARHAPRRRCRCPSRSGVLFAYTICQKKLVWGRRRTCMRKSIFGEQEIEMLANYCSQISSDVWMGQSGLMVY